MCLIQNRILILSIFFSPAILRPGIITKEQLEEALGKEVLIDKALLIKPELDKAGNVKESDEFRPKSPGMKYKHYAPKAEMYILRGDREKVAERIETSRAIAAEMGQKIEVIVYDDAEPETAAHGFFARLRECDRAGTDIILAVALPETGVGFAVMNRMFKSAGYNIIDC